MLVTVEKTFTESKTIELPVPFFAKHLEYDWYYLITEDEAIQVLPWETRIESKEMFYSGYHAKVKSATEGKAITEREFHEAYDRTTNKFNSILSKIKNTK